MVSAGHRLELVIVKSLNRLELAIVGAWQLLDFCDRWSWRSFGAGGLRCRCCEQWAASVIHR
jgi:hypothetical protein